MQKFQKNFVYNKAIMLQLSLIKINPRRQFCQLTMLFLSKVKTSAKNESSEMNYWVRNLIVDRLLFTVYVSQIIWFLLYYISKALKNCVFNPNSDGLLNVHSLSVGGILCPQLLDYPKNTVKKFTKSGLKRIVVLWNWG